MPSLLYICDWLPPDFGAVGQYSLGFARQRAAAGDDVVLAGLSSTSEWTETEHVGAGRLTVLRFQAAAYDRGNFRKRALWTLKLNLRLLWRLRWHLRSADEVLFTGSPPFLLHFLAPLNLLLRKRLVYRITDFHPECLMAGMARVPWPLKAFHRLTVAWRKTIDRFEVLGEDQRRRLLEIGIPADRIELKRDPSPVAVPPGTQPLERPDSLAGYAVLLYSGNFGVAHDHETFIEGYRLHHTAGSGRVGLWLNATGAKADLVERLVREAGLPIHRGRPVPLEQLPRLLVTPDAHLITLRDAFVGYVMPSKVYGSIESCRDIVFIGSAASDVHLLCRQSLPSTAYHHIATAEPAQVATALEALADRALGAVPDASRRRKPVGSALRGVPQTARESVGSALRGVPQTAAESVGSALRGVPQTAAGESVGNALRGVPQTAAGESVSSALRGVPSDSAAGESVGNALRGVPHARIKQEV